MAHGHLKWDQNELMDEQFRVQKIWRDCHLTLPIGTLPI